MKGRDFNYYRKKINKLKNEYDQEDLLKVVLVELIESIEESVNQSNIEIYAKIKKYLSFWVDIVKLSKQKFYHENSLIDELAEMLGKEFIKPLRIIAGE